MSTPILKNEVITFPEGTDPDQIKREFCDTGCAFANWCSKPQDEGGKIKAENVSDYLNDEFIQENAKCAPEIEGRPAERF